VDDIFGGLTGLPFLQVLPFRGSSKGICTTGIGAVWDKATFILNKPRPGDVVFYEAKDVGGGFSMSGCKMVLGGRLANMLECYRKVSTTSHQLSSCNCDKRTCTFVPSDAPDLLT
jgi:hypothetical protein